MGIILELLVVVLIVLGQKTLWENKRAYGLRTYHLP